MAIAGLIESQGLIQLRINTTPARLEIKHGKSGIEVDSTVPREEIGYRHWHAQIHEDRRVSKLRYDQGIDRIVTEGDRLAQIENPNDPIPEMAASRLDTWNEDHVYVLGFIPRTPPEINVRFSPAEISYESGVIKIRYGEASPRGRGVDIAR